METYCVSCKKYTANENLSVKKKRKKKKRLMHLSNCAICGKKRSTFFKRTKNSITLIIYQVISAK